MRRRWPALAGLVLLCAGVAPAWAHHKPGHSGGPSHSLSTTTTLPATTTTGAMPTSTTVVMGPPGPSYGADAVLGESLEPATTIGTEATTSTIASVLSAAQPGDTILLRAGNYGSITVPAGTAENPITVKAYDNEVATITAQSTLNSHTRLAKVLVESDTAQWLFRIGATSGDPITDVEIRNSTLRGGTTEAVRIRQLATDIRLLNLDMEGGLTGHVIKWHNEGVVGNHPSGSMSNIRLRKRSIANGGIFDYNSTEDLLQVEQFGAVTADRITFGAMQATTQSEDGLDVKTPGAGGSFVLSRGLFEGPFGGAGFAAGGEAAILQGLADDITVRDSKVIGDSLSIGATSQNVSALLERVWFVNGSTLRIRRSGESPRLPARIRDVVMDGGTFQLGTTTGGDQPTDAELTRLVLTGTDIVINAGSTYTCTDGTFSGTTGDTLTCS